MFFVRLFLVASYWRNFLKIAQRRRMTRTHKPLPLAPFKQDGSRAAQHCRAKSDTDPLSSGRNRRSAVQQT
jgi:hypothetical protein